MQGGTEADVSPMALGVCFGAPLPKSPAIGVAVAVIRGGAGQSAGAWRSGIANRPCGFRTSMNPARPQKRSTRSARLRSRVIVVGPNSADLVGVCSILGLPY
jgi:hypothetical protein